MTPDDRNRFLAVFASTWPHPTLDETRVLLWHRDLEPMDTQTAFDALEVLRTEENYQPSLAKFVEQYRALRRVAQLTPTRALPASPPTDQWRRFIELAKEAAVKEYPHDHHHGAAGCPTCGPKQ